MSQDGSKERVAGVLGGMGPDATVDFMKRVIELTDARKDQQHVRMLVDHNPKVPSRQNLVPDDEARVRHMLAEMALRLQAAGADFLVMVCNTAHAFDDEARRAVSIPFISIVDETVRAVGKRYPEARTAGVMATPGLIDSGLYQRSLSDAGLAALPVSGSQRSELMNLIWQVKAGERGKGVCAGMAAVANELIGAGADVIIAGCTEIPLVLGTDALSVPLLSSTDELARRTVELALGKTALAPDTD